MNTIRRPRRTLRVSGPGCSALLLALIVAACSGGNSQSEVFDAAGPKLAVTPDAFAAAYNCSAAQGTSPEPRVVLLIHGTGLNAAESWSGNYYTLLPVLGYATCTIDLPDQALDDIQVAAEYAVAAIRETANRYHLPVDVLTHSQGGLEARWALKFWPDLAAKVDDVVMLAAPNHGTLIANTICLQQLAACTAAIQQQRVGSDFLAALNRDESAPAGVSFTNIYSATDEIVTELAPNYTSAVAGASNVLIQSFCLRPVTHLEQLTNPVSYALILDAFTHDGGADPARIDPSFCRNPGAAPGITPNAALATLLLSYLDALRSVAGGPVATEPPLAPYAR